MKISLFAALLAVSFSSSAFATLGDVCPKGSKVDEKDHTICMKDPNCSPCDEGWFYKHPNKEKGYDKPACIQCSGGYTWDTSIKKCVELMH